MEAFAIRAIQIVEEVTPCEVGMIKKKVEVKVYQLIHGMNAGQWTAEIDGDCLIVRQHLITERIPFAEMDKDTGLVKSFEVIKFEITEKGVTELI